MIGPTALDTTDKEDLATSDSGFRDVLSSAQKLVPSIRDKDIIAYFAGLRPACGNDFIIRHEETVPYFVNVAGIQSPGLTAAPAIALMVSAILKDNGLIMKEKLLFRPRRRKTAHLFFMPLKKAKALIKKDPAYGDIICRCEMVSAKEVTHAVDSGATTLDGIKFRTRAQAGRCHGAFCTTRLMKIIADKTGRPLTGVTKRGKGSEMVKEKRKSD
jgi:glycerol-3-phosphate dehydrogenase